jgi:hypothetical protein
MLCTFCGTENRPEYKFCGICGVRLDRRQLERRLPRIGAGMKCGECGHVDDAGLKFCGMCGTRVERRMQERRNTGDEPRAAAIANAQLPTPDVARRVATQVPSLPAPPENVPVSLPRKGEPAIFRNEPGNGANISGPSFLGLNSQPDGNVEYLLEDEPTGGGLRKLVLLLILAAILGLVFVQWRSSFKANPKPVPAKTEPSTPSPGPQGSNQPQGSATTDQLPQEAAKVTAAGLKTVADAATVSVSQDQKPGPAAPASETTASSDPADVADKKTTNEQPALAPDSKPAEEARLADYKPSAALVRAQQYIRGHGVQQNCEQGLMYLHAATDKNDPGAAIQMAALYSSGLCVKQDRVMAYRWFNSAHELQPANIWIQKNMDQLWAQMTSQERRLAGY